MYRNYNNFQQYNDQRFFGPILPFIGGALIGYVAGRPNLNTGYYQPYYPVYYQYPPYQYYQSGPITYTN